MKGGMKVSVDKPNSDPRRRMTRHQTDAVRSSLGDILDLSGTGLRMGFKGRCPIKVGQTISIKLKTPHGSMVLAARAVWRRRTGLLGGCQIGFNFDGINASQSVALATIARFGFIASQGVRSAEQDHAKLGGPASVEASIVMAKYYECLGLAESATPEDVKIAYRKLARQYHPDVAPGQDNQRKFLQLREAYDLLNDHLRRAG